ncbi:MAG: hypothetical protein WBA93_02450 [Microcoleaceae cyanobacterium]
MLYIKSKVSKFRQVSINRTCDRTFSVAIRKPVYGHNYYTSSLDMSSPRILSPIKNVKLNNDI